MTKGEKPSMACRTVTANQAELDLITMVLRKVNPSFAFDQTSFVLRFIDRCHNVDDDLWQRAVSSLSCATVSGMRTGMPGQPMPRDVSDRDNALAMLARLSKLSPAYELYQSILHHAERNISQSRAEAEAWEDE